ncbi:hypothetical protein [Burkholderia sp. A2]|uniref:hypothetical protein n=1 Tax=Burkholderia sp. A2 TaxID=236253 RepID=UPI00159F2A78|nr:hypothetical protein [Burkholderia sp. A2]
MACRAPRGRPNPHGANGGFGRRFFILFFRAANVCRAIFLFARFIAGFIVRLT